MKTIFLVFGILGSLILPIIIVLLFFVIFSGFYNKGFLTGLGQLMVCGFMMLLNSTIILNMLLIYCEGLIESKEYKTLRKAIIFTILISVAIQTILSILIENPFRDPSSGMFL
ncbi:hypothetical protein IM700_010135 [Paenibacillus sp. DXFW5]|uniref:Uncharacterized protein n=1 Tax=Paenibacillus rhizolycopersici TaxID=2780073 RepID=A0ABS2H5C0_9BACL|nr:MULTISPECIES: hypothetical protein [Paenibacillus]MBM6996003.1 hypothetical protein [Paenibacillus rhizolycopersici]MUG86503.1 hypothetical protein [Paenibacillus timonensis]